MKEYKVDIGSQNEKAKSRQDLINFCREIAKIIKVDEPDIPSYAMNWYGLIDYLQGKNANHYPAYIMLGYASYYNYERVFEYSRNNLDEFGYFYGDTDDPEYKKLIKEVFQMDNIIFDLRIDIEIEHGIDSDTKRKLDKLEGELFRKSKINCF